ncbi:erythromycin esterase family protein [Nocardia pseudobrasiliensis]|uniref:Erythromycin esterase n=1 Tax=Nocardia pseudobrasiliensis TaxID=45979 RepID=A0A370I555_9NOCA|nr:erythromycin esterase family protein [Nocardia pseudobrasiliensis]RDI65261.1 erythromycin esterase [Nocardia pseudobrasiliensis]
MSTDTPAAVAAHTHSLSALDSATDAELAAMADIADGATVVALGEGAHFVAEFGAARRRLLRYLVEQLGFTVLAFEFGFAEAFALDAWLRGDGPEAALSDLAGTMASGLDTTMALWLRRYNATAQRPVRLIGVDVPVAGGTLRPALEPLIAYLDRVDPEQTPLARRALDISARVEGDSAAAVAPRWAALDESDRTALAAALSRLSVRMRALEPLYLARGDRESYELARRHLDVAVHTEYMFTSMHELLYGTGGLPMDPTARDWLMADTLRWHLDRLPGEARVVLMAHNNHIQKTPIEFEPGRIAAYPMGYYLAESLGDAYHTVAFTHTADTVPEMVLDTGHPLGFRVEETATPTPTSGSFEDAVAAAGFAKSVSLTNLRPLRGDSDIELTSLRSQSVSMPIAVAEAFDAVLTVPTTTNAYRE